MAWQRILTISRLDELAWFYRELAEMLEGGIPLLQVVAHLRKTARSAAFRKGLTKLEQALHQGYTFGEAIQQTGNWLPELDHELIVAAEKAGRLPESALALSEYYQRRMEFLRLIVKALGWPLLTLAFAFLILPLPLFVNAVLKGQIQPYIRNKIMLFGTLGAVCAAGIFIGRFPPYHPVRRVIERIFWYFPGMHRLLESIAVVRLTLALKSLLEAGVVVPEAWKIAVRASGSAWYMKKVHQAVALMEQGALPSEALASVRFLPDKFLSLYQSGETSGQLDDSLDYIYRVYFEQAKQQAQLLSEWGPRVIYLLILLFVGYGIVQAYFWHYQRFMDTIFPM